MEPQVSSAKFSPMTASLLARKGDAAPSLAMLPVRPSAFAKTKPASPPPPPFISADAVRSANGHSGGHEGVEKPRRIMVSVTADEFEKLGIAAIKKDRTRHEIVRAALDAYFVQLAAELPRKCNCMTDGPCCS
jgi:hypothetical protein